MAEIRTQLVAAIRKQLTKAAKFNAQARESMDKAQDAATLGEEDENAPESESEGQPPGEQVLAGTDEWIRLHKLTGLPIATLQRKVQSPYECRLVVSREAPSISGGRKIFCGEFPEFSQEFPFNLSDIKQAIAAKFGGELWRLSIQDAAGQTIRDIRLRLALPPLNHGEAAEDRAATAEPEDEPVPEQTFPESYPASAGEELDAEMNFIMATERKRTHIATLRKQRKDAEEEAQGRPQEDDKFAQILSALKERPQQGDNQMVVLISAMQASAQQQQKSLELVVAGIADKAAAQQQSQLQMFDMMSRMMDSKAASQAEVARVQMESKKSEMEMMLRVVDGRREDKDMAMDKMLELLQLGMQWKTGTVPSGEEATAEKPDWIGSLVQGLATLISSKVAIPAVEQPAAAPQLTAQPAPPTPEIQEARNKKIQAIAEAAAKNAVARHKAQQEAARLRRAAQEASGRAPATPPEAAQPAEAVPAAPAAQATVAVISGENPEQCKALMTEILETTILELEDLPVRSETVQLAFDKAPPEWRAKLCSTDNAKELGDYFKVYADPALVEQIKEKAAPSQERQQWLLTQAGVLRNAFIRQAESLMQQGGPTNA